MNASLVMDAIGCVHHGKKLVARQDVEYFLDLGGRVFVLDGYSVVWNIIDDEPPAA